MSLRLRLFLVLAGLAVALLAAQVWWVRSLAGELSNEVNAVAFSVGRAVASVVEGQQPLATAPSARETSGEPLVIRLETAPATEGESTLQVHEWRADEARSEGLPRAVLERIVELEAREGEDGLGPLVDEEQNSATRTIEATPHRMIFLSRDGEPSALTLRQPGDAIHRIPIPQSGLRSRLDRFTRRMVGGTLALLAVALVVAAFVAHRVSAPLRELATAAREVGQGRLATRVRSPATRRAPGEVGEAIAAFDRMAERLEELDAETKRLGEQRHLGEIGEVARGLAHSLRNPLHALGLSLEELADRAGDDGEATVLATGARRQIARVDRSLRSFLTLAGSGGGAEPGPVDPRELIDDVALEALHDGRGARVEVTQPAGAVAPLSAVEPELRAVVQALVVNAVDASPASGGGRGAIEVELLPRDGGEGLVLRVLDRGPGLAPEVRRRLFSPHLTTKAEGAGMGLYLAHKIATSRYGGDLVLADREGGGTVATLTLGPRVP